MCDQGVESHPQVPGAPPPHMILPRGRRRQIDTTGHFCPHAACSYHGRIGFGNIRANGHPNGRRWRQLACLGCSVYFLELHGTPFHAKQVDPDKLVWAIAALAEGLGIRPLFLTDGLRDYLTALVTHYGQWMQPEHHQVKGPRPRPRWMPLAPRQLARAPA